MIQLTVNQYGVSGTKGERPKPNCVTRGNFSISDKHLGVAHRSVGWWPPWGLGGASRSRRCWWNRSGCVSGHSAAPHAGSLRSRVKWNSHHKSINMVNLAPSGAHLWYYTKYVFNYESIPMVPVIMTRQSCWCNLWPSVSFPGTSSLLPGHKRTHKESSSPAPGRS